MSRASRSIFAVLIVTTVSMLSACSAFAADFSMTFDDAVIDTGYGSLTPGVNHHNDLPVESRDVASLDGTIEDDEINVPAAGVVIKREVRTIKSFASYYTVDWKATTSFTGTFDAATGLLELEGSIEQIIEQGTNRCVTGPLPLSLSTENENVLNAGARFTNGLDGPGTLVGKWVAPVITTVGPDCDRDDFDCLARSHIAAVFGDVALSTERGLKLRGPASYDRCDGPPQPVGGPKKVALTSSPGTLGIPGAEDGSYQLDFASGGAGARFTIGLGVPQWPDQRVWGSALVFGEAIAAGVKTIDPLPLPPLSPSVFECFSGAPGYGTGYTVEMRPNSAAIVTLPVELVTNPWTADPLTPRITISYFNGFENLEVPPITISGRLGPWVKVWTKGQKKTTRPVKAGKSFKLVGHVYSSAKLKGRRVKLWSESSSGERQALGKARVNDSGNFGKKVKGGLPFDSGYRIEAKLVKSRVVPSCGSRIILKK